MYKITLTERFKASHSLDTIRPQPHEHEWIIRVVLEADTLEPPGIVVNYFELKPFVYKLLPHGQDLNTVYDFAPTGENLAKHFFYQIRQRYPQVVEVSVGEFEEFMCTFCPTT